jgi:hypothetical protein
MSEHTSSKAAALIRTLHVYGVPHSVAALAMTDLLGAPLNWTAEERALLASAAQQGRAAYERSAGMSVGLEDLSYEAEANAESDVLASMGGARPTTIR